MTSRGYRFGPFRLDPADRRLTRDGAPVELNGRYLDALALLVREQGRLVSKERFMDEVWRGTPVTDEALTQCIRTLRRQLGDDAAKPRFIETVPKHGYRFIAPVQAADDDSGPTGGAEARRGGWSDKLMLGAAGMLGGGAAGAIGGLLYGSVAASQPAQAGMGALSVMLVLGCLTMVVGLLGGAGVGLGIAAAGFGVGRSRPMIILGGAAGGLLLGAVVKLVGLDAFNLLFGRSPGEITGAPEGALLGAAAGLGAWLASREARFIRLRRTAAAAALFGAAAGGLIPLLGGRLMAGSLDTLAHHFPASRLRLDPLGRLFGESGFGPISQAITGALEGGLFSACVVTAMILARRSLSGNGIGGSERP